MSDRSFYWQRLVKVVAVDGVLPETGLGWFDDRGEVGFVAAGGCCFSKHVFHEFLVGVVDDGYEILVDNAVLAAGLVFVGEGVTEAVEREVILFSFTTLFAMGMGWLRICWILFGCIFDIPPASSPFVGGRMDGCSGMNGTIGRYFGVTGGQLATQVVQVGRLQLLHH